MAAVDSRADEPVGGSINESGGAPLRGPDAGLIESLHTALEAIERSPGGTALDRLTLALQALHRASVRREQALDAAVRTGTIGRRLEAHLRDELEKARQLRQCAELVWRLARLKAVGGDPLELDRIAASSR